MSQIEIEIDIHIKVSIPEEDVNKVLRYAEEMGYGYGDDPGKKEIIRRLIISDGVCSMNEIIVGEQFKYERVT